MPLPRCPAKKRNTIRALEWCGDFTHSDWYAPPDWFKRWHLDRRMWRMKKDRLRKPAEHYHIPCRICSCSRVAGLGTNHHGWGLCIQHERVWSYHNVAEQIAELHLRALQQRHPRYYLEMSKLMEDKIQLGKKTDEETTELQVVAQDVGNILKNFYKLVSEHDRDATKAEKEAIARLDEIRELLKTSKLSTPNVQAINDRLKDIETRLCCPLTELSHGRVVPMTDATRVSLVARTLPQLTRAITDVFNLQKERWVTEASFDIWLSRLLTTFVKRFGEATFVEPGRDGASFPIVEHIAECLQNVGDPRRGT